MIWLGALVIAILLLWGGYSMGYNAGVEDERRRTQLLTEAWLDAQEQADLE